MGRRGRGPRPRCRGPRIPPRPSPSPCPQPPFLERGGGGELCSTTTSAAGSTDSTAEWTDSTTGCSSSTSGCGRSKWGSRRSTSAWPHSSARSSQRPNPPNSRRPPSRHPQHRPSTEQHLPSRGSRTDSESADTQESCHSVTHRNPGHAAKMSCGSTAVLQCPDSVGRSPQPIRSVLNQLPFRNSFATAEHRGRSRRPLNEGAEGDSAPAPQPPRAGQSPGGHVDGGGQARPFRGGGPRRRPRHPSAGVAAASSPTRSPRGHRPPPPDIPRGCEAARPRRADEHRCCRAASNLEAERIRSAAPASRSPRTARPGLSRCAAAQSRLNPRRSLDVEGVEIHVADFLEQRGRGGVGQGLGQPVAPSLVFALQLSQLVDRPSPPGGAGERSRRLLDGDGGGAGRASSPEPPLPFCRFRRGQGSTPRGGVPRWLPG